MKKIFVVVMALVAMFSLNSVVRADWYFSISHQNDNGGVRKTWASTSQSKVVITERVGPATPEVFVTYEYSGASKSTFISRGNTEFYSGKSFSRETLNFSRLITDGRGDVFYSTTIETRMKEFQVGTGATLASGMYRDYASPYTYRSHRK